MNQNISAVDKTLDNLVEVKIPAHWKTIQDPPKPWVAHAQMMDKAKQQKTQARAYSTSTSAYTASTRSLFRSASPRSGIPSLSRSMVSAKEIKDRTSAFVKEIVEPVN